MLDTSCNRPPDARRSPPPFAESHPPTLAESHAQEKWVRLPQSTTYSTSSIVIDVSAMFVVTTTFRKPLCGRWKTSRCSATLILATRGVGRPQDAVGSSMALRNAARKHNLAAKQPTVTNARARLQVNVRARISPPMTPTPAVWRDPLSNQLRMPAHHCTHSGCGHLAGRAWRATIEAILRRTCNHCETCGPHLGRSGGASARPCAGVLTHDKEAQPIRTPHRRIARPAPHYREDGRDGAVNPHRLI